MFTLYRGSRKRHAREGTGSGKLAEGPVDERRAERKVPRENPGGSRRGSEARKVCAAFLDPGRGRRAVVCVWDYREVGTAAGPTVVAPGSPRCVYLASLSLLHSRLPSLLRSLSVSSVSLPPARGRLGYCRYLRRVRVREPRTVLRRLAMRDLGRKLADGAASR